MSSTSVSIPSGSRTLHICTLCSLAFAQPILTALARQSVYLQDQQFGGLEIGGLLCVLMLAIPLACVVVDRAFVCLSAVCGGWGRDTVLMVVACACLLSLLRPCCSTLWMLSTGFASIFSISMAISGSWLLTLWYDRSPLLRSWLTATSIGMIVFPSMFLWNFSSLRTDENPLTSRVTIGNPVPVVFVVIDEISGTTLVGEEGTINARCFPQFARLAEMSTWYRNATTVSPRTDIAVPTILSGRFPVTPRSPLAAEYPRNLFQLIQATEAFEMVVFEPLSRLSPSTMNRLEEPNRSNLQKCGDLLYTLATVYPHLMLTSDNPLPTPSIPHEWFGFSSKRVSSCDVSLAQTSGTFRYPCTDDRSRQLYHFLNCLQPTERPGFYFLHAVIPHCPWTFLASGDQYQSELGAMIPPLGSRGVLGEDWDSDPAIVLRNEFRYRQQVGYVDRFVGRLLDRLEETGLLKRCLLVVMADHGVSFRPGHSRRLPDAVNLPDLMSIPLFIKLPGQTTGRIDDCNVQSVDVFPTVAEVLELSLPEPVDGIPVSHDMRHPRKTFYYERTMTLIEPDFLQRKSSVQRQINLFGTDSLDRLPPLASSHPDWHNRSINSFQVDGRTIPVTLFHSPSLCKESQLPLQQGLEPCFISGRVYAETLPEVPAEIVVVADGVVWDTCQTTRVDGGDQDFQIVIPAWRDNTLIKNVELYIAETKRSPVRLIRLNGMEPREP